MAGNEYVRCMGSWKYPDENGGCPHCGKIMPLMAGALVRAHRASKPQPANYWSMKATEERAMEAMRRFHVRLEDTAP